MSKIGDLLCRSFDNHNGDEILITKNMQGTGLSELWWCKKRKLKGINKEKKQCHRKGRGGYC